MPLDFKSFGLGVLVGAGLLVLLGGMPFLRAYQRAAMRGLAPNVYRVPVAAIPVAAEAGPSVGDPAIAGVLQAVRQQYEIPAMAAAIVTGDGAAPRIGAAGVLKRGTNAPVRLDCLWHLGSDTKAMTSALVARLVERRRLRWDSTLAEIFPDLEQGMHPAFRRVTLRHLLSHRAGLPANLPAGFNGPDVQGLRLRAVRESTAHAPQSEPGSTYLYSNLGYIIAGAVVEKVTDQSWEDAIAQEIFTPLHMATVGFGGTGTIGEIDQPWPHTADGAPTPRNGPTMDNPPVLGPAGRVHCTIQDWARFAQDQLRGSRGEPALLQAGSYQEMHTPPFGGDYALGWIVADRPWGGGGKVFNHVGDNTMNCANVWIAPKRNFAILVCANRSGPQAFQATDAVVGALLKTMQPL